MTLSNTLLDSALLNRSRGFDWESYSCTFTSMKNTKSNTGSDFAENNNNIVLLASQILCSAETSPAYLTVSLCHFRNCQTILTMLKSVLPGHNDINTHIYSACTNTHRPKGVCWLSCFQQHNMSEKPSSEKAPFFQPGTAVDGCSQSCELLLLPQPLPSRRFSLSLTDTQTQMFVQLLLLEHCTNPHSPGPKGSTSQGCSNLEGIRNKLS